MLSGHAWVPSHGHGPLGPGAGCWTRPEAEHLGSCQLPGLEDNRGRAQAPGYLGLCLLCWDHDSLLILTLLGSLLRN